MVGGTALSPEPAAARVRGGVIVAAALLLVACAGSPSDARVQIPRGAGLSQVADSLATRGVISSPLLFKLAARAKGVDRRLRPGVYDIPAGTRLTDLLALLTRGRTAEVRFTVPEGLTLYEVAALADAKLGVPADSVIAAATDARAAGARLPGAPSFEGLLFPETYSLPADVTPRGLVEALAAQFDAVWDSTWNARVEALGLTRLQLLTLASLVEGEARVDDERPIIAGVYYNRWKIGMALQADPTVQYALVQRNGGRKPRLYTKDYALASPYNTYLHPGFPPGPVNSPGRASIAAALAPADVPFKFFVAGPDGRHRFAETFEAHRRNVSAMRRAWAEARRQAAP